MLNNIKIRDLKSPNFGRKKRSLKSVKAIVFHYTGMQSERESIKRLCNPKFEVSCHYLINQNGNIYRLVQDNKIAWHAGKSCWAIFKNLNNNSIGIELVNKGHRFGYTNFKKKQLSSLINICKILIKKYKIKKKYIVGHSDIAPLRKKDPGEKFPWKKLSQKNIGIWHDFSPTYLKKFRKKKISLGNKNFFKYLSNIGYCLNSKNRFIVNKAIKAFQRRFRKELINGLPDQECLIIARNLSYKV